MTNVPLDDSPDIVGYESVLQKDVLQFLERMKRTWGQIEFYRMNSLPVPVKDAQGNTVAYRPFSKYSPKGLADIMILFRIRHTTECVPIFLEIKRPGVKIQLRPSQSAFRTQVMDVNAVYLAVNDVNEVEKLFWHYYYMNIPDKDVDKPS